MRTFPCRLSLEVQTTNKMVCSRNQAKLKMAASQKLRWNPMQTPQNERVPEDYFSWMSCNFFHHRVGRDAWDCLGVDVMKSWELKCKDKAESLRRSVGLESFYQVCRIWKEISCCVGFLTLAREKTPPDMMEQDGTTWNILDVHCYTPRLTWEVYQSHRNGTSTPFIIHPIYKLENREWFQLEVGICKDVSTSTSEHVDSATPCSNFEGKIIALVYNTSLEPK